MSELVFNCRVDHHEFEGVNVAVEIYDNAGVVLAVVDDAGNGFSFTKDELALLLRIVTRYEKAVDILKGSGCG